MSVRLKAGMELELCRDGIRAAYADEGLAKGHNLHVDDRITVVAVDAPAQPRRQVAVVAAKCGLLLVAYDDLVPCRVVRKPRRRK